MVTSKGRASGPKGLEPILITGKILKELRNHPRELRRIQITIIPICGKGQMLIAPYRPISILHSFSKELKKTTIFKNVAITSGK